MSVQKVMCMIDDFAFQAFSTGLESVNVKEEYGFNTTPTLAGFDDIQATGKYKTTKTLAGILIQQGADALEPLKIIARNKNAVDYVSANAASGKAQKVIIHSISEARSFLLSNGVNLKCDFTVEIEVVHE